MNPRFRIIAIVVGMAVVLGAAVGLALLSFNNPPESIKKVETRNRKKQTQKSSYDTTCPLDGREADTEVKRPLAIMVENLSTVRPQAGPGQACIVVEGLAEGGITRFMLVFGAHGSKYVGPVRSARTHFVSLAKGWDAIFGHVGGSKYALADIRRWDVFDWDQSAHGTDYTRIDSARAPHNVFTSTKRLRDAASDQETRTTDMMPVFDFKKAPALKDRPAGLKSVIIDFSDSAYRVEYQYDRQSNTYKRFNGGSPHTDANTKKQIGPADVVVIRAPHASIPGGSGVLDVNMTGAGEAIVFRDGKVINGTWSRADVDSALKITDQSGEEIKMTAGQIWIEIVKPTTPVRIQE